MLNAFLDFFQSTPKLLGIRRLNLASTECSRPALTAAPLLVLLLSYLSLVCVFTFYISSAWLLIIKQIKQKPPLVIIKQYNNQKEDAIYLKIQVVRRCQLLFLKFPGASSSAAQQVSVFFYILTRSVPVNHKRPVNFRTRHRLLQTSSCTTCALFPSWQ